jgi:hypothetical protein
MSSWLFNSTDSSQGADRKNEQYWDDVIRTYNETTFFPGKEIVSKPRTGGTRLIDGLTVSMMLGLRLKEFSVVDTMSKCGLRRLMSST